MEITAPGGDLEKIKYAVLYGADAVYTGFKDFGLRASATNLQQDELLEAIRFVHQHGAKLYLTLNAYLENADFPALKDFIRWLNSTQIDAVIVSDAGVFSLVKEHSEIPIHISTQANICNLEAARFWYQQGAKRIVLAREMKLKDIRQIKEALPKLELECFIHGAMCIAYSGRCLLSAYMNRRSANKGACTHPCRWNWALTEESRPGEYFPIEEDAYGSYILSSKDLCTLPILSELMTAGIDSGKIEGRMKSLYYVAQITRIYRAAHDSENLDSNATTRLMAELEKVSHREYWQGFYEATEMGIDQSECSYSTRAEYCGKVVEYNSTQIAFDALGKISLGDTIEIIYPLLKDDIQMKVENIYDSEGQKVLSTRPNFRYFLDLPDTGKRGALIRRCV